MPKIPILVWSPFYLFDFAVSATCLLKKNYYAWKMRAPQCFSHIMNGLNAEKLKKKKSKSWWPFWIYQSISTANSAQFHSSRAGLTVLITWYSGLTNKRTVRLFIFEKNPALWALFHSNEQYTLWQSCVFIYFLEKYPALCNYLLVSPDYVDPKRPLSFLSQNKTILKVPTFFMHKILSIIVVPND